MKLEQFESRTLLAGHDDEMHVDEDAVTVGDAKLVDEAHPTELRDATVESCLITSVGGWFELAGKLALKGLLSAGVGIVPCGAYRIMQIYKGYDGTDFHKAFNAAAFQVVVGTSIALEAAYLLFMPGTFMQSKTWDESLMSLGIEIMGFTTGLVSTVMFLKCCLSRRDASYSAL